MNRSKGVNRLFLAMILLSVISPIVLQEFFLMLDLYQSLAVSQLIFLLPVLIYLALGKGEMLGELQIRWLGVSEVLMVLLLGVLLLPVVTWINLISMLFVTNYVSSAFSEVQTASLGMNFIYMALLPALSEEFMFRGVFFHGYRRAGILKAALRTLLRTDSSEPESVLLRVYSGDDHGSCGGSHRQSFFFHAGAYGD